jgi:hypothetical protein
MNHGGDEDEPCSEVERKKRYLIVSMSIWRRKTTELRLAPGRESGPAAGGV